jgi:excisionase family DNA binding protein
MALVQLKPGLTCAEVAERLGISLKTVWRLIERQELDALVAGPRLYFVTQQSFGRYLERVPAGEKK